MSSDIASTLARLADKIDDEGGRLSLMAEHKDKVHAVHGQPLERWTIGAEWGQEEPGSEMYGGAAYGAGDTLQTALAALVQDMGDSL